MLAVLTENYKVFTNLTQGLAHQSLYCYLNFKILCAKQFRFPKNEMGIGTTKRSIDPTIRTLVRAKLSRDSDILDRGQFGMNFSEIRASISERKFQQTNEAPFFSPRTHRPQKSERFLCKRQGTTLSS